MATNSHNNMQSYAALYSFWPDMCTVIYHQSSLKILFTFHMNAELEKNISIFANLCKCCLNVFLHKK